MKILSLSALLVLQACISQTPTVVEDAANAVTQGKPQAPTPTPLPDVEPPVPTGNKVPVFVASGHVARTVMSCDNGRTWINDRSDVPSARCWDSASPNNLECDHQIHSGHGITYDDGYFYAAYGWGYPGTIRRSQDGFNWEIVRSGITAAGVQSIDGTLLALIGGWPTSTDQGLTWEAHDAAITGMGIFVRDLFKAGPFFIATGDGGFAVSSDKGTSWTKIANTVQSQGAAYGNGVLVSIGTVSGTPNKTMAYRSVDNGATFTAAEVLSANYISWNGRLHFDGTNFVSWIGNSRFTSPDGMTWTAATLTSGRVAGPVARGPDGQYVQITAQWGGFYENQKAFRSTDGLSWTELSGTDFVGGHPISSITHGYVDSSVCP